ncbi:hypothetical protein GF312_11260 [Candidatus Poribacteria bacterium]|nr:hypothetical protein [Candidatus Poribacteria bacterium]
MNQRTLSDIPKEQKITIQEMFQNHPKKRLREKARKGTRPEIPMGDDHKSFVVFSAADPIYGRVHYRISDSPSNHTR